MRILLFVAAGLLVLLAAGSVYIYSSGGDSPVPGVAIDALDPWYLTAIGFVMAGVGVVVMLIIVDRLRRVFATLAAGDPFVPENAEHLRVIWITIALFELGRYAAAGIASLAIHAFGGREAGVESRFDVDLLVWFAVLVIFVLAEVFREGARMRQEQQLTI